MKLLIVIALLASGCMFPEYRKAKAEADLAEVYAWCVKHSATNPRINCTEARVAYWRGQR